MIISSEQTSSVSKERSKWKSVYHLVLMVTPNLLNPHKLAANLRHPLREVFHTSHRQYPVEMKERVEYHVVEHRRLDKLEVIDIVRSTLFLKD